MASTKKVAPKKVTADAKKAPAVKVEKVEKVEKIDKRAKAEKAPAPVACDPKKTCCCDCCRKVWFLYILLIAAIVLFFLGGVVKHTYYKGYLGKNYKMTQDGKGCGMQDPMQPTMPNNVNQ